MNDERDPSLQILFASADEPLEGTAFSRTVMVRVEAMRRRRLYARFGFFLAVIGLGALVGPSLINLAGLATVGLSTTVIDLGSSVFAQALLPLNNVATLLILAVAILFGAYRKVFC
ncbi:MAG: hypothetical protein RID42_09185 [Alphaproteobacteria bacterium]